MNLDNDALSTDEYLVTAQQIFECCGADRTGTLRVDPLMDKFAPFVKTNKAEYSYLKSLLDPHQSNPEIDVTELAQALNKYSESQKIKVDLDESFNLRSGPAPQDSDSGISSDGYQLLEELQCELREKARQAHQLRSQLDYTDRQHEEALATLTAERDSLRAHLSMLREENMTLSNVRRDYEEACERLCSSEQALLDARKDLEVARRSDKLLKEEVVALENEKLTLQELLTKSKDECHRINEMYAGRQSALLEESETLKAERAELAARLQDQEQFMQQLIREKVLLEMELKDMLNKSNQIQLRLDRSIDVSYTEDQMLTALDSLNADSRFAPENRILDEESFLKTLKEDQGRATNLSLFDEIRLSFNHSRNTIDLTQCHKCKLEALLMNISTQTDGIHNEFDSKDSIRSIDIESRTSVETQTDGIRLINTPTQTDQQKTCEMQNIKNKIQNEFKKKIANRPINNDNRRNVGTQTDKRIIINTPSQTNKQNMYKTQNSCVECKELKHYTTKLESDIKLSESVINEMQLEIVRYEGNLDTLEIFVKDGNKKNEMLQDIVTRLQTKIAVLDAACANQTCVLDGFTHDTACVQCQTESEQLSVSTQVDVACVACEKRKGGVPQRTIRRYLWDPIKCLFQIFAVVCFVTAISLLYGVTRQWGEHCEREPLPWKWLHAQDLMDLFLRIEYVSDVPM